MKPKNITMGQFRPRMDNIRALAILGFPPGTKIDEIDFCEIQKNFIEKMEQVLKLIKNVPFYQWE